MTRRVECAQPDRRFAVKSEDVAIFDKTIDRKLISQRLRRQTMSGYGNAFAVLALKMVNQSRRAGNMVRMNVSEGDFPHALSFGHQAVDADSQSLLFIFIRRTGIDY